MRFDWSLVAGPTREPITVQELKAQARVTHSREDAVLDGFIVAARTAAEQYLERGLYTQLWRMDLEDWPEIVHLPMAGPLQAVTIDAVAYPLVQYYDTAGSLTTLASSYYTVHTHTTPGQIVRAPGQSWPGLQSDRLYPVRITYAVGWSDVSSIPETIKQGIRMYAAHLHLDREGASPDGDAARRAAMAAWCLAGALSVIPPEVCR